MFPMEDADEGIKVEVLTNVIKGIEEYLKEGKKMN
jgi:hypothetical protein